MMPFYINMQVLSVFNFKNLYISYSLSNTNKAFVMSLGKVECDTSAWHSVVLWRNTGASLGGGSRVVQDCT